MKESISQFDKMTKTPVAKLVISLSIPTVISMLVTNVYNLVDTAFVGTLGTSQSGAVGIVFGYMAILQAIGFLFGQGAGSILSRRLGEKNVDEASRTASTGFFAAFAITILVAIFSWIFLDRIVAILGSTDTIAPHAKIYIRCILLSAPFTVTTFTLNNFLRYEGKAMLGMIALVAGAVLNIGGDALFMFAFHMGILGAGISTAISQTVSFAILLSLFLGGKTQSKISFRHLNIHSNIFWDITGTGSPSLLRQCLNAVCTIVLNFCAKPYGDPAVAAMSITSRIFFFIFAISIGIGQGFQPISAFNYGAKKYGRIRSAFRITFFLSEILMAVSGATVAILAPQIVPGFRDDPTVIKIAVHSLRLHCLGGLFLPFSMVTEMLHQSTGRKIQAILLSSMRNGLFFIPIILLLSHFRGLAGIQEAQPLSFLVSVIPSIIFAILFFRKLPDESKF